MLAKMLLVVRGLLTVIPLDHGIRGAIGTTSLHTRLDTDGSRGRLLSEFCSRVEEVEADIRIASSKNT